MKGQSDQFLEPPKVPYLVLFRPCRSDFEQHRGTVCRIFSLLRDQAPITFARRPITPHLNFNTATSFKHFHTNLSLKFKGYIGQIRA